jgi:hypothetical protein
MTGTSGTSVRCAARTCVAGPEAAAAVRWPRRESDWLGAGIDSAGSGIGTSALAGNRNACTSPQTVG